MLGIIAWIRPDGRKALVVVAGSEQMASGDPGPQAQESLKVGDLVTMSGISDDPATFQTGLTLVRSGYWPQIVRDISAMAKGHAPVKDRSNVVDMFGPRTNGPRHPLGGGRRIVAAELPRGGVAAGPREGWARRPRVWQP